MTNENRPVKEITAIVVWYAKSRRCPTACGNTVGADGCGPGAKLFFGKDAGGKARDFVSELEKHYLLGEISIVCAEDTWTGKTIKW